MPPVRLFQAYEEEVEVDEMGLGDEELDAGSADAKEVEVTCKERGRCSDDDDDVEVDVLDAFADVAVGTTQGMEGGEEAAAGGD